MGPKPVKTRTENMVEPHPPQFQDVHRPGRRDHDQQKP